MKSILKIPTECIRKSPNNRKDKRKNTERAYFSIKFEATDIEPGKKFLNPKKTS